MTNCIHVKEQDVIIHTCPGFTKGLFEAPLKSGRGWVITSNLKNASFGLSMPQSQFCHSIKKDPILCADIREKMAYCVPILGLAWRRFYSGSYQQTASGFELRLMFQYRSSCSCFRLLTSNSRSIHAAKPSWKMGKTLYFRLYHSIDSITRSNINFVKMLSYRHTSCVTINLYSALKHFENLNKIFTVNLEKYC